MTENKSMDATPQRPEGTRMVDGALTTIDLEKYIESLRDESTWKESDRNSITVHKSDNLVIVLIGLHEKAELTPHKVEGISSLQVLKGKIDLVTEEKNTELEKQQMIVLHENIFHSITALEESFLLLSIVSFKEK